MIKRLSVITAVFFLLTAFTNPAFAGIYDVTKAINDAKQNYSDYYRDYSGNVPGQDKNIHYVTSTGLSSLTDASGYSYGFLVYGQPHGDVKDSQSRYIGYTYYGEDFTNMDFPADKNAGGADFASQNWISQPWDDQVVQANNPNLSKFNPAGLPGDGDSQYHAQILAGLMAYGATNANNGFTISSTTNNPSFWDNVEQYIHILAPPGNYAYGIGRMWHYDSNGNLWYVTVPIAPYALINQPELVVTPVTATIDIGQSYQFRAYFYPEGQATGNGLDVTNSSTWSSSDNSIASPVSTPGLFTGNSPGQITVTATYAPPGNGPSLTGQAELIVEEQQIAQPGNPNLWFTAVSQDGSITRPNNTAKWTDQVTAHLEPPSPSPPRGTLDSWSVTSASLTYPKKNPEFTFGDPLDPVGTLNIGMDTNGHKATVTFEEDWSLNGADIWDILNDRMVPGPTPYDITADYTIHYSYHWYTTKTDSEGHHHRVRHNGSGSDSGSFTAVLTVNGTGVNSQAE